VAKLHTLTSCSLAVPKLQAERLNRLAVGYTASLAVRYTASLAVGYTASLAVGYTASLAVGYTANLAVGYTVIPSDTVYIQLHILPCGEGGGSEKLCLEFPAAGDI